jgi:hypothetical protein
LVGRRRKGSAAVVVKIGSRRERMKEESPLGMQRKVPENSLFDLPQSRPRFGTLRFEPTARERFIDTNSIGSTEAPSPICCVCQRFSTFGRHRVTRGRSTLPRCSVSLGKVRSLDAFKAAHPFALSVPLAIEANEAFPLGFLVGPSEKAELYEYFATFMKRLGCDAGT